MTGPSFSSYACDSNNFFPLQNLPHLNFLDMAYNELRNFDFDYFDQVGTLTNLKVNVSYNSLSDLFDTTTSFISNREQGNVIDKFTPKRTTPPCTQIKNEIRSMQSLFFRHNHISFKHQGTRHVTQQHNIHQWKLLPAS